MRDEGLEFRVLALSGVFVSRANSGDRTYCDDHGACYL